MAESLDVLVVAPHPDDAELGMGGAILKMLDAGLKVGILDLTNGEPTPHGSLAIRAAETDAPGGSLVDRRLSQQARATGGGGSRGRIRKPMFVL